MKYLTRIIALSLLALAMSACGSSSQQSQSDSEMMGEESTMRGPTDIDGHTAQRMNELGATLIDVRIPEEFEEEHIPGAVNIPLADISAQSLADHGVSGPVIVYCNSGNQSGQALQKLRNDGYRESLNMGSIDDWPGDTVSSDESSSIGTGALAQMDESDETSPVDDGDVDPVESDESPVGIDDDNNSLDNNGDDDSIDVDDDDNDSLGGADDI